MAVTRRDVALAAGVSPAVVSFVINKGPRRVSDATRKRVEAAIEELGYRPNAIASALRGGTTRSIGVLTPNYRNPFYAELVEAMERHFALRSYLVLAGSTYYDRAREERLVRTFLDRRVDGLILCPGLSLIASPGREPAPVPWVALDEPLVGSFDGHVVRADDERDARTAVQHLQNHGHRLIGCVCSPTNIPAEARRVQGWVDQQTALGAPSGDELVAYAECSEEGGAAAAEQLLSIHGRPWALHGQRPSALFVTSDHQAMGVLSACAQLGLRVPEDVAVVSVGGTSRARYSVPPLTSLRQDVEYLASQVADLLTDEAKADKPQYADGSIPIWGNLVVARSCGC